MNNEFDPTNTQDPNYDPTLHHQAEELRNQPPAPAAEVPSPLPKVTPTDRYALLTDEEREAIRGIKVPGLQDAPTQGLALSDEQLFIKRKLANEPRTPMFIPLDPGEKPGAYRSVTINGYRSEVKKGKMVQLPVSIAKLLMDAYQIEAETLNDNEFNLANADASKRAALGLE